MNRVVENLRMLLIAFGIVMIINLFTTEVQAQACDNYFLSEVDKTTGHIFAGTKKSLNILDEKKDGLKISVTLNDSTIMLMTDVIINNERNLDRGVNIIVYFNDMTRIELTTDVTYGLRTFFRKDDKSLDMLQSKPVKMMIIVDSIGPITGIFTQQQATQFKETMQCASTYLK